MIKLRTLALLVILILAFAVRLYKIDNPIADWHSWRQADTAAVARNFVKSGFNFLRPQVDNFVITNDKGLENRERLFYVEPPIYQTIVFIFYKLWGVREYLARFVSIIFSLATIIFIYLLAKKYFSETTALFAAFFFAFIPYSIYYGRVILPEPLMLFATISSIYFTSQWVDKNKLKYFILAILATAITFLTKAYMLVLLLPIIYLFYQKFGSNFLQNRKVLVFLGCSVIPLVLWRVFISFNPEAIPSSVWLFNGGNIRFTGAFFHWIFAERLGKLILAYGGVALFIVGLLLRPGKKEGWLLHWWVFSIILYFFILARGNVTHDYYQLPFMLPAVLFLAKGTEFLLRGGEKFSRLLSTTIVIALILAMFAFGWFEIRGFYWINHPEIVEAGRAVDRLTSPDARVIAPYSGDVAFLYQTDRHGWAVVDRPINILIQNWGATHYVSTTLDPATLEFAKQYQILEKTQNYIILDLTKPATQ